MEADRLNKLIGLVRSEQDLNARAMMLAGLISELFRERGFHAVIVGGSAIEFYTDGSYMSGDTDICWAGTAQPTPDERGEIMSQIPGAVRKGTRSWRVDEHWIDLLGEVTRHGRANEVTMQTPAGSVSLIPVEELIAERVFAARRWTGYNAEDDDCAKKLLACVLRGQVECDWAEARRIAGSPAYRCLDELEAMKSEVEKELEELR